MAYYLKKTSASQATKALRYRLRQLPLYYKLIGFGSLISIVSIFLPWVSYESRVFNGVEDITFLIGYIIFILSLLLFLFFILHLWEKKLPRLPVKEYTLSMFSGLQIILLSLVAFSVYNRLFLYTSTSEIRFGLTGTIIAGVLICIGSYLAWREEKEESVKKTFMHVPEATPGKDLEKFFQKSKENHKLLSAEETGSSGADPTPPPSEGQNPDQSQPPNLKMFEE